LTAVALRGSAPKKPSLRFPLVRFGTLLHEREARGPEPVVYWMTRFLAPVAGLVPAVAGLVPVSLVLKMRRRLTWLEAKPIARNDGASVFRVSVVHVNVPVLPSITFVGGSFVKRSCGKPAALVAVICTAAAGTAAARSRAASARASTPAGSASDLWRRRSGNGPPGRIGGESGENLHLDAAAAQWPDGPCGRGGLGSRRRRPVRRQVGGWDVWHDDG
jgi:hypothetical protein